MVAEGGGHLKCAFLPAEATWSREPTCVSCWGQPRALFAPHLCSPRLNTECVHILPQHSHARVACWRRPWPALREIGRQKGRAGLGRGAGRGGRLGSGDGEATEEGSQNGTLMTCPVRAGLPCGTEGLSSPAAGKVIS